MVTHVESPIVLWVQFVKDNNAAELTRIGDMLAENGQVATPLTTRPELNRVMLECINEFLLLLCIPMNILCHMKACHY